MRYIGCIALFWSISLIGKLIQAAFPEYSFQLINSKSIKVEVESFKDDTNNGNNNNSNDLSFLDAAILFSVAIIFDIIPYFMIADVKFVKIFTFDLILKHQKKQKDLSDNENANILRRNEQTFDDDKVDREAILQGELGGEIINIRN